MNKKTYNTPEAKFRRFIMGDMVATNGSMDYKGALNDSGLDGND